MAEQFELVSRYGMRAEQFSELMGYRVREILLVASPYDAFVLEEDGQLTELIFQEYRKLDLNIRHAPRFTTAENGEQALQLLAQKPFDMVVATARLADMPLEEFGRRAKAEHGGLPLAVLAAHAWDIPHLEGLQSAGAADWVFLWQGDVRTLLALVEQEQDRRNADHDVLTSGVQAIILVDDDVRFVSFFLPHLYTEVTQQTSRLMAEGLNLSHRLLRLQARPKILLAATFEEAWRLYERYSENVLGLISDVSFPRDGRLDAEAGLELAARVRRRDPDLPVLLQSTEPTDREAVASLGVAFLHKGAPSLIEDVRRFMLDNFGFGDFVFRLPDQTEVGRASNLRQLLTQLERVPEGSLEYHANRNHFSRWFKARTEFELASLVRPRTVAEFGGPAGLRNYLTSTLVAYLREIQRHVAADFDVERFDEFVAFAKIGSGSLGGKGRGLAFMQKMLAQERFDIPGVELAVPQTVALASDVFEGYLDQNKLRSLVLDLERLSDGEILDAFRRGRFDRPTRGALGRFLHVVKEPIAVRSSSILEDSPYQPFAGVYATIMLPNNHPSLDVRLAQLLETIKVVYASTYMKPARDYLETTPHRLEEERMAVLLQRLVGSRHGDRFYPTVSGVAASYNFYPFRDMKPEDGVALVACGLGKSVVEGFDALRFCPAYPQVLPQFSSVKDMLRNAQRRFWALDMSRMDMLPSLDFDAGLVEAEVTEAFADGNGDWIASTYLAENDALADGIVRGGTPLVSFSRVLKGRGFPMPQALTQLLAAAHRGMAIPVEIEFAVDLKPGFDRPQVFHVLQVRPMMVERMTPGVDLSPETIEEAIVFSPNALGHGRTHTISDVVVVFPDMERARTREAATVIERLDREMRREGRPYVLIGPGRWGSRDPWLGIPVVWSQISGTRAIVETDFRDLDVEPSQGSHFFHHLTSFGVTFLAVHRRQNAGKVKWAWLLERPAVHDGLDGKIRHLRLERPLQVLVDGATRRGVILPRG